MALKKKKMHPVSKKVAISKKKKITAKRPTQKKSVAKKAVGSVSKKLDLPDIPDLYERARWKKERREYWRNRFRKILATVQLEPKPKK